MARIGQVIREWYVETFTSGLITRIENEALPKGAASDSLNWMTEGDKITLRRGQQLIGTAVDGAGKITGLKVATRFDGTQVPFMTHTRKMKYYDTTTEDWIEIGTDSLPEAASGEDIAMDQYHSLAGAFVYLSSKNSSIYKIPIANPGSLIDQVSTSHRGKIRIKQNRMFLWDRKDASGGFDATGIFGSYIDKDELSDYTEVTGETGFTGAVNSTNKNYTHTLAFKAGGAKRSCMYVSVVATTTGGTETFRDDRNGGLVSNFGGTGTINYATGAVTLSFFYAPSAGNVTASYYWEDATSTGICDFTKSTPRTAGQGFTFRQDDGGADAQNIFSLGSREYCMHTLKTWDLFLSADDTDATNLIYRSRVGIPYWRAGVETGEGIYYVDSTDINEPTIRLLRIGEQNAEVIPVPISTNLELSDYRFDNAVALEWGVYIVIACRTKDSSANDTVFMYHKLWRSFDKFDFRCSTLDVYNGALIAGDSASNNVFTLFSFLTDEESEIPNYWISGKTNLDSEGVKVANRFEINGYIGSDQSFDIDISYDGSDFVNVATISGQDSYVDQSQSITVGSNTLGSEELGGGGGITASPFRREFLLNSGRFETLRVRFRALGVGYASISKYGFKDIRFKSKYLPPQYLVN